MAMERTPIAMNTGAHRTASLCGAVCGVRGVKSMAVCCERCQSQDRAPPDWYSITRVSKKLRSFLRSIISLIHGNGFSSLGNNVSSPICVARRLAM